MIEVPLTQGQIALIDDVDADLAEFNWFAIYDSKYKGGAFKAARKLTRDGKRINYLMHRNIMANVVDRFLTSDEEVDHIDYDLLNNVRSNLRLVTRKQNSQHKRMYSNNTSGYKGVNWNKPRRKWVAYIRIDGVHTHLGMFENVIEAAKAYDSAARKHYGIFAVTNFEV